MRRSVLILALIVAALPLAAAHADDTPAVEQARQDGHDIGQGTHDTAVAVGTGVETTATKFGHGIRDTAIQVGHGVDNAAHAVGAGFESGWNSLTGKDDRPH